MADAAELADAEAAAAVGQAARAAAALRQAVCRKFGLTQPSDDYDVMYFLAAKLGYTTAVNAHGTGFDLREDPAAAQWARRMEKKGSGGGPKDAVSEENSDETADDEPSQDEAPPAKRSRTPAGAAAAAAAVAAGPSASAAAAGGAEDGSEFSGGEEQEDAIDYEPEIVEDDRKGIMALDPDELGSPQQLLAYLLAPATLQQFLDGVWQQRPLLVSRPGSPAYFAPWFSRADVDALLRTGDLQHTLNVDVTSYTEGKRSTLPAKEGSPEGVAEAAYVWKHFEAGCSVRMLHPQRWCDALWKVLGTLECFFRAPVGCNAYLTPPGRQGFAPHSDDIDAFILQLEGTKRWRVYAPRSEDEVLRRDCSPDYSQEDIRDPVLEVELQPGDLLYMPRGAIHQAEALPGEHSLHVTISVNQRRTWADFLVAAMPAALEQAAAEDVALRTATPPDLVDYMGVALSDRQPDWRAAFAAQARSMAEIVLDHLPLDEVADQMAADFMHDRLPPVVAAAAGNGGTTPAKGGEKRGRGAKDKLKQGLRLAAPYAARLVVEEGADGGPAAVVHHAMANSRVEHAEFPPGVANGAAGGCGGGECCDGSGGGEECGGSGALATPGRLEFPLEAAEVLEAILHPASVTDGSTAASSVDLSSVPPAAAAAAEAAGAGVEHIVAELREAGVLVPGKS